jgi:DNA-binding NarL/FixJ family response regulator
MLINVILAEDRPVYRMGIANILAVEDDIRIVGQCELPERLLKAMESFRPRVAIVSSGFRACLSQVLDIARRYNTAVLALCDNTEVATDFMRLGTQGAIYRCAGSDMVLEAVRRLARAEFFLQGPNFAQPRPDDNVGTRIRNRLTVRELRIIASIVEGYKYREIAEQFGSTEQTIKNAVRIIFDKTGVSDRLELSLFVIHHRILAEATARVQSRQIQLECELGEEG